MRVSYHVNTIKKIAKYVINTRVRGEYVLKNLIFAENSVKINS